MWCEGERRPLGELCLPSECGVGSGVTMLHLGELGHSVMETGVGDKCACLAGEQIHVRLHSLVALLIVCLFVFCVFVLLDHSLLHGRTEANTALLKG